MTTVTSSSTTPGRLELYCWPTGDNEALLIKTPGNRWGVIDCGLRNPNPKLRDPEKLWTTLNDLKEFLHVQGVKRLAFAQLSHPEKDHAKGLYELLREFELEIFFAVPGSLKRTMLGELNELIESRLRAGQTRLVEATPGKVMWEEAQHDFRLVGLGPSSRDIAAFTLAALRKIKTTPNLTQQSQNQSSLAEIEAKVKAGQPVDLSPIIERLETTGGQLSYNRLSIITLGLYGPSRMLLGGDALAFSWRELSRSPLYNQPAPDPTSGLGLGDLKARVFKVPHHGASDGLPLELTPTFVHRGAISLISSSGHGFSSPSKEILLGLTELERAPYCTGRSAWCPGQPIGRSCCGLIRVQLGADGTVDVHTQKRGRVTHPVMCLPTPPTKTILVKLDDSN